MTPGRDIWSAIDKVLPYVVQQYHIKSPFWWADRGGGESPLLNKCNCRGNTVAVCDVNFLDTWVQRLVDIIQYSLDALTLERDHRDIARGLDPSTFASRNLRYPSHWPGMLLRCLLSPCHERIHQLWQELYPSSSRGLAKSSLCTTHNPRGHR